MFDDEFNSTLSSHPYVVPYGSYNSSPYGSTTSSQSWNEMNNTMTTASATSSAGKPMVTTRQLDSNTTETVAIFPPGSSSCSFESTTVTQSPRGSTSSYFSPSSSYLGSSYLGSSRDYSSAIQRYRPASTGRSIRGYGGGSRGRVENGDVNRIEHNTIIKIPSSTPSYSHTSSPSYARSSPTYTRSSPYSGTSSYSRRSYSSTRSPVSKTRSTTRKSYAPYTSYSSSSAPYSSYSSSAPYSSYSSSSPYSSYSSSSYSSDSLSSLASDSSLSSRSSLSSYRSYESPTYSSLRPYSSSSWEEDNDDYGDGGGDLEVTTTISVSDW